MIRGLSADYKKIANLSRKLAKMMDKTNNVKITTSFGEADITMNIEGRKAIASKGLFHKKGESGNLPTGEAFAAPVEGTTNGVFVSDESFAGVGKLKTPIKIVVENGYASEISGGEEAQEVDIKYVIEIW